MSTKKLVDSDVSPIWEGIYSEGRSLNRYPFDQVVSFLYRNYSRAKPRSATKILEIGCGAGNNLWFAAREGFTVAGLDGSSSAIKYAQSRFAEDGLKGDLRVGDFISLPYADNTFDFVLDRASLTCSTFDGARRTVKEILRVLIPAGKFFFNPYSDHDTSYVSGKPDPYGRTVDIKEGTKFGVGAIYFYSKRDIFKLFTKGWKLISLQHLQFVEELEPFYSVHAEWIAIAEKI